MQDREGFEIPIQWFNAYPFQHTSLANLVSQQTSIRLLGEPSFIGRSPTLINPKILKEPRNLIVQYSKMKGVPPLPFEKLIHKAIALVQDLEDEDFFKGLSTSHHYPSRAQAFAILHGRTDDYDEKRLRQARERLIYEEFFRNQCLLFARKRFRKVIPAPSIELSAPELEKMKAQLPYQLTDHQEQSLDEVLGDLKKGEPMMRLLQGDVGCGKTTVALLAAMALVKNQKQVAIMAPTETLARQHFQNFKPYFSEESLALFVSSLKAATKKKVLKGISHGEHSVIIGTHALFQESVAFKNLALVIIDEQHRFGVRQRIQLSDKGEGVHTLIMSATPIPRSLALTQYGDLDISTIKTLPHGEKKIKTRIVDQNNFNSYLSFIKTRLEMGEQGFVVAPAIETDQEDFFDLELLQKRYHQYFPQKKIALLHGKMKAAEKTQVMESFAAGEIALLLATTVIEVGIDVPAATHISIVSAERFGLSTLHQLRGRVGRGKKTGFCFLVTTAKTLSPEARERLSTLEKTLDGHQIAEMDLQLRGHGHLFGHQQSGSENSYRLANPVLHFDTLAQAKEDFENQLEQKHPWLVEEINRLGHEEKVLKTI